MAQILKQPPSQVLPTVKCSDCNFPVPLDELGDHVCSTPSPVPTLPKPIISPGSAASLLPTRLQNLVSPRSSSFRSPTSAQPSPSRSAAQNKSSQQQHQQHQGQPNKPGSSSQAPLSPRRNQIQSPLSRTERPRTPTVGPSPLSRSEPLTLPTPSRAQERTRSSSAAQSSFSHLDPQRAGLHPPDPYSQRHGRASSATHNAFPRSEPRKVLTPVYGAALDRSRTPPTAAAQRDRQPPANSSPLHSGSTSQASSATRAPRPPENVAHPPSHLHTVFAPPLDNDIDTKIGGEAGMAGVGRRGFAAAARAGIAAPSNGAVKGSDHIPGMDGRRANAPAYLNIASFYPATPPLSPNSHSSPSHSPSPTSPSPPSNNNDNKISTSSRSPSPSMQLLPSDPQISASINSNDPTKTPTTSASGAPRLPFFEKYKNKLPGANSSPNVSPSSLSRTQTPQPDSKIQPPAVHFVDNHQRNRSNGSNRIKNPLSVSSASECGLAYAESTSSESEEKDVRKKPPPPPLILSNSPAMGDKSQTRVPTSDRKLGGHSKSISSTSGRSSGTGSIHSDKDGPASIARALGLAQVPVQGHRYSGGPGGPVMTRSDSSSSANRRDRSALSSASGSSIYSKSTGTGTGVGGLEKAMETLLEDNPGALDLSRSLTKSNSISSAASTSNDAPFNGAAPAKSYRSKTVRSPETKAPKLPVRSRTSPTMMRDAGNVSKRGGAEKRIDSDRTKEKRKRQCVKCQVFIQDGRWVQMDEGSVLCEKCWKNMYLPKCRRCSLTIENQAVSSSDGQLKGKYHRACFNCHVCHKPFPDKTFYVFDGKPLCAYHYHEANKSLCTLARCGQPIEGPCAVSHSGDRYHPEHFLCEYAGYRPCRERLVEYWEVDGMMLCERHASKEMDADADLDDSPAPSARAMKRVTRFIDLAGGGVGNNAF